VEFKWTRLCLFLILTISSSQSFGWQIWIKPIDGDSFHVEIDEDETLDKLYNICSTRLGIPAENIKLISKGQTLQNSSDVKIPRSYDPFNLVVTAFVKLNGTTFTLDLKPGAKKADLYQKCAELFDVSIPQIKLVFNGRVLENNDTPIEGGMGKEKNPILVAVGKSTPKTSAIAIEKLPAGAGAPAKPKPDLTDPKKMAATGIIASNSNINLVLLEQFLHQIKYSYPHLLSMNLADKIAAHHKDRDLDLGYLRNKITNHEGLDLNNIDINNLVQVEQELNKHNKNYSDMIIMDFKSKQQILITV
jgi:hypothetical protein